MKLMIFDLDGTLLNTLDDLADSANFMLESMGFPTHYTEEYKYFVGNGIPKLIERCLPENARSEKFQKQALEIFSKRYGEHYTDKTRPYEGIPEMLDELAENGVKLAVASNKADAFTQALVKRFFGERFDIIRGSLPGVPRKPSPEIVYGIMSEIGAEKSETVFVGDSGVDITTAKNAGVRSIGCLWGFRTKEELISAGAVNIAETPEQIPEFTVKEQIV